MQVAPAEVYMYIFVQLEYSVIYRQKNPASFFKAKPSANRSNSYGRPYVSLFQQHRI